MKKTKFLLLTLLFTLFTPVTFATSGACSNHGGVSCSAGSDYDGSVICNDGWTESSVSFSDMSSCDTDVWTRIIMEPIDPMTKACSNVPNYLTYYQNKVTEHKIYEGDGGYGVLADCMNKKQYFPTADTAPLSWCPGAITRDSEKAEKLATEETIAMCASYTSTTSSSFSDISNYKYKSSIEYVRSQSIIDGYSDSTYKPDALINRAEFTKIVVNAVYPNQASVPSNCFVDVKTTDWFSQYVCFAKDKGIIGGYPDGTFRPNSNINMAEALKISIETFFPKLLDQMTEDEWWVKYTKFANTFNFRLDEWRLPTYIVSRGEIAEMIYRMKTFVPPFELTPSSFVDIE